MSVLAPRLPVDAPPGIPRPWSLLTTATVLPMTDAHAGNGVEWQPGVCEPADAWEVTCEQGGEKDQHSWDGPVVEAEPFVVYGRAKCGVMAGATLEQARAKARANLLRGEAYTVERTFMEGTFGQSPSLQDATDVSPAAGTLNPVGAMATLEAWLSETYLGVGVIHVPPAMVPYLCRYGLLERRGEQWVTCGLGTRVAIGAGYTANIGPDGTEAPAGEAWLYATGQVVIYRSDVMVSPDDQWGVNHRTNDVDVIAERVYALGYECSAVAVRSELSC